jgi:AbrB family looped-hinge helix DNA binding protein
MSYQVTMAETGQVMLPDELVREFDLKPGDSLVVEREDGRYVIKPFTQVVREVQAEFRAMLPPGYTGSLADELIAERRAEARRENAQHGG